MPKTQPYLALNDKGEVLLTLDHLSEHECSNDKRDWIFYTILFKVLGQDVDKTYNIYVKLGSYYSEQNTFGHIMTQLGFVPSAKAVRAVEGFKQVDQEQVIEEVKKFIKEREGRRYAAQPYVNEEGWWAIHAETLKELKQ